VSGYAKRQADVAGFEASRALFESVLEELAGPACGQATHAELEERLTERSRELMRQLLQDHLEVRASRERRAEPVAGADGVNRTRVERGHQRSLATVFGEVRVQRLAYRAPDVANLYPTDALLNLPAEKHSHGLRRLAAVEAARGSFDGAAAAIARATGVRVGKRQVEDLAARAAADFEAFYTTRQPPSGGGEHLLVLSYDGKGVVMRRDALRAATAKKAATASAKLATRLSKGEKRNRKRMAEVGAVYDAVPTPRTPADILPADDEAHRTARPRPRAASKWLTASVTDDAATVVAAVFDEACRRDPAHERTWVALVDGNKHQIDRTHAEATARGIDITIVVDFVHVLEYIWKAAWCFFAEGDPAAETWVREKALTVLDGKATRAAAAIRRKATTTGLNPSGRKNADAAATYLTNKAPYLDYPTALEAGWPIATGVIEGACRHLVKDRMDITGARWGLPGAEAILKLRALTSNGDFDQYWHYHLTQERQRLHQTRYANSVIPLAA
jgi:hypothetical protein